MHNKEISKRIRHYGGGEIPSIACQHRKADHAGLGHADQLTGDDLALNHAKFYSTANKVKQDDSLLKLMTISSSKRQRVSEGDRQKSRNVIVKYSLFTNNREQPQMTIPVGKATFTKVLSVYNRVGLHNY